jgi:hypothetical protein
VPAAVCQRTIDFEDFEEGEIVANANGDESDGVHVHATNPRIDEESNAAVIFDSSCSGGCSGNDEDLGTPNEDFGGPGVGDGGADGGTGENPEPLRNVLIVDQTLKDEDGDGLVDDPNDQKNQEVSIELDFSDHGPVVLLAMKVLDVEANEGSPGVVLFADAQGDPLAEVPIPPTGNNGVARVEFERVEGATRAVVTLFGSGAIDDIEYEVDCPTTTTMGESTTTTVGASTTTLGGTSTTTLGGTTTTAPGGSTTTTLPGEVLCGDASGDGRVTARDALLVLKSAVGAQRACAPSACDVDASSTVTAADALRVLRVAVGGDFALTCN